MNTANLKSLAFWADLALTIISLGLASGLITSATWTHDLGWVAGILTTLGYHAFNIGGSSSDGIATSPGVKS